MRCRQNESGDGVLLTIRIHKGFDEGFEIPDLPDTICQLEDGDSLIVDGDGSFEVIRKN